MNLITMNTTYGDNHWSYGGADKRERPLEQLACSSKAPLKMASVAQNTPFCTGGIASSTIAGTCVRSAVVNSYARVNTDEPYIEITKTNLVNTEYPPIYCISEASEHGSICAIGLFSLIISIVAWLFNLSHGFLERILNIIRNTLYFIIVIVYKLSAFISRFKNIIVILTLLICLSHLSSCEEVEVTIQNSGLTTYLFKLLESNSTNSDVTFVEPTGDSYYSTVLTIRENTYEFLQTWKSQMLNYFSGSQSSNCSEEYVKLETDSDTTLSTVLTICENLTEFFTNSTMKQSFLYDNELFYYLEDFSRIIRNLYYEYFPISYLPANIKLTEDFDFLAPIRKYQERIKYLLNDINISFDIHHLIFDFVHGDIQTFLNRNPNFSLVIVSIIICVMSITLFGTSFLTVKIVFLLLLSIYLGQTNTVCLDAAVVLFVFIFLTLTYLYGFSLLYNFILRLLFSNPYLIFVFCLIMCSFAVSAQEYDIGHDYNYIHLGGLMFSFLAFVFAFFIPYVAFKILFKIALCLIIVFYCPAIPILIMIYLIIRIIVSHKYIALCLLFLCWSWDPYVLSEVYIKLANKGDFHSESIKAKRCLYSNFKADLPSVHNYPIHTVYGDRIHNLNYPGSNHCLLNCLHLYSVTYLGRDATLDISRACIPYVSSVMKGSRLPLRIAITFSKLVDCSLYLERQGSLYKLNSGANIPLCLIESDNGRHVDFCAVSEKIVAGVVNIENRFYGNPWKNKFIESFGTLSRRELIYIFKDNKYVNNLYWESFDESDFDVSAYQTNLNINSKPNGQILITSHILRTLAELTPIDSVFTEIPYLNRPNSCVLNIVRICCQKLGDDWNKVGQAIYLLYSAYIKDGHCLPIRIIEFYAKCTNTTLFMTFGGLLYEINSGARENCIILIVDGYHCDLVICDALPYRRVQPVIFLCPVAGNPMWKSRFIESFTLPDFRLLYPNNQYLFKPYWEKCLIGDYTNVVNAELVNATYKLHNGTISVSSPTSYQLVKYYTMPSRSMAPKSTGRINSCLINAMFFASLSGGVRWGDIYQALNILYSRFLLTNELLPLAILKTFAELCEFPCYVFINNKVFKLNKANIGYTVAFIITPVSINEAHIDICFLNTINHGTGRNSYLCEINCGNPIKLAEKYPKLLDYDYPISKDFCLRVLSGNINLISHNKLPLGFRSFYMKKVLVSYMIAKNGPTDFVEDGFLHSMPYEDLVIDVDSDIGGRAKKAPKTKWVKKEDLNQSNKLKSQKLKCPIEWSLGLTVYNPPDNAVSCLPRALSFAIFGNDNKWKEFNSIIHSHLQATDRKGVIENLLKPATLLGIQQEANNFAKVQMYNAAISCLGLSQAYPYSSLYTISNRLKITILVWRNLSDVTIIGAFPHTVAIHLSHGDDLIHATAVHHENVGMHINNLCQNNGNDPLIRFATSSLNDYKAAKKNIAITEVSFDNSIFSRNPLLMKLKDISDFGSGNDYKAIYLNLKSNLLSYWRSSQKAPIQTTKSTEYAWLLLLDLLIPLNSSVIVNYSEYKVIEFIKSDNYRLTGELLPLVQAKPFILSKTQTTKLITTSNSKPIRSVKSTTNFNDITSPKRETVFEGYSDEDETSRSEPEDTAPKKKKNSRTPKYPPTSDSEPECDDPIKKKKSTKTARDTSKAIRAKRSPKTFLDCLGVDEYTTDDEPPYASGGGGGPPSDSDGSPPTSSSSSSDSSSSSPSSDTSSSESEDDRIEDGKWIWRIPKVDLELFPKSRMGLPAVLPISPQRHFSEYLAWYTNGRFIYSAIKLKRCKYLIECSNSVGLVHKGPCAHSLLECDCHLHNVKLFGMFCWMYFTPQMIFDKLIQLHRGAFFDFFKFQMDQPEARFDYHTASYRVNADGTVLFNYESPFTCTQEQAFWMENFTVGHFTYMERPYSLVKSIITRANSVEIARFSIISDHIPICDTHNAYFVSDTLGYMKMASRFNQSAEFNDHLIDVTSMFTATVNGTSYTIASTHQCPRIVIPGDVLGYVTSKVAGMPRTANTWNTINAYASAAVKRVANLPDRDKPHAIVVLTCLAYYSYLQLHSDIIKSFHNNYSDQVSEYNESLSLVGSTRPISKISLAILLWNLSLYFLQHNIYTLIIQYINCFICITMAYYEYQYTLKGLIASNRSITKCIRLNPSMMIDIFCLILTSIISLYSKYSLMSGPSILSALAVVYLLQQMHIDYAFTYDSRAFITAVASLPIILLFVFIKYDIIIIVLITLLLVSTRYYGTIYLKIVIIVVIEYLFIPVAHYTISPYIAFVYPITVLIYEIMFVHPLATDKHKFALYLKCAAQITFGAYLRYVFIIHVLWDLSQIYFGYPYLLMVFVPRNNVKPVMKSCAGIGPKGFDINSKNHVAYVETIAALEPCNSTEGLWCYGISTGPIPSIFRSCWHNMLRSLGCRQAVVRKKMASGVFDHLKRLQLWNLKKFHSERQPIVKTPFYEYVKKYDPADQARLIKFYESWIFSKDDKPTKKFFIKQEKQHNVSTHSYNPDLDHLFNTRSPGDTDPRNISGATDESRVLLGPIFDALDRIIKSIDMAKHNITTHSLRPCIAAKGLNPEELSRLLFRAMRDQVFSFALETDGARWDGTMALNLLRLKAMVYHWHRMNPRSFLSWTKEWIVKGFCKWFTFCSYYSVASGSMDTSTGNTEICKSVHYAAVKYAYDKHFTENPFNPNLCCRVGCKHKIRRTYRINGGPQINDYSCIPNFISFCAGDDNAKWFFGPWLEHKSANQWAIDIDYYLEMCGIVPETVVHLDPLTPSFCSGRFIPCDGLDVPFCFALNWERVLTKAGWSTKKYSFLHANYWAQQVSKNLCLDFNHVPIVRAYAKKYYELAKKLPAKVIKLDVEWNESTRHCTQKYDFNAQSLVLFEELYGVTPQYIYAIEETINGLDKLGHYHIPLLDDLLRQIIPKSYSDSADNTYPNCDS